VDASLKSRLVEALGSDAVDGGADRVRPASAAEVALVCRVCADTATPLSVSSRVEGTPPAGGIAVLLDRLDTVDLRSGGLTLTAGAGATIEAVTAAVSAAGLITAAPLTAGAASRVGGAVASAAIPRRALCGIEAVLPTGDVVRAGGAVLKDVAGYDLVAILLGSRGRLGLITSATFRLLPAQVPETTDGPTSAATGELSEAIRSAFDPAGLLRS
jgi:glycolate dehydrogenase FAD-linked subunit